MLRSFSVSCLLLIFPAWSAAAEPTVAELFQRVNESVVVLLTGDMPAPQEQGSTPTSVQGLGSGFLISADGLVMTAAHVVQSAEVIAARFANGDVVRARVVASAPAADVALVQVEKVPAGATVAALGDSDAAQVGDPVLVIGAPMGLSHSLSVGHLSARRISPDQFGGFVPVELLQTDAAINTGNSGGPMFDMSGKVIGIVSRILSRSGGFEGLGFAVASTVARKLLLEEPSEWSGLSGRVLEPDLAAVLNLPHETALLVEDVADGSPAALLGLRGGDVPADIGGTSMILGGDVILEVQGIRFNSAKNAAQIQQALSTLGSDGVVAVTILRGGQQVHLTGHKSEIGLR